MSWSDLRKGRYSVPNAEYFITFNTSQRIPFFNNFYLAQIFCQQISVIETRCNCSCLSWVLMPDHFHGLIKLNDKGATLGDIIGALKGRTSFYINKRIEKVSFSWQPAFYDHALRKEENRIAISRYIVANPLRKGIVKRIEDYSFWNSVYL